MTVVRFLKDFAGDAARCADGGGGDGARGTRSDDPRRAFALTSSKSSSDDSSLELAEAGMVVHVFMLVFSAGACRDATAPLSGHVVSAPAEAGGAAGAAHVHLPFNNFQKDSFQQTLADHLSFTDI
jgi:hypothetical protein